LNGKVIADMEELQNTFSKRIDRCHYDPSSWDCHVINKNYNVGAAESALAPEKDGTKMSFMVMVTGSVKFWMDGHEKLDEEPNGFAESFILVPNREAYSPKAPKNTKKWLIQSQNFRRVT
jgi:NTF2-related export protein 1/2